MPYCPHCGNEIDTFPGVAVEADREPVEVTLAKIDADKAIKIAQLEARARRGELDTQEAIAETYAEAEAVAAVVHAEAVASTIEAQLADAPSDDAPVVVDAPVIADDIADDAPSDDAPPPVEGSPIPPPPAKRRGLGMW